MREDVLESDPGAGGEVEAAADEVLRLGGHVGREGDPGLADLPLRLEGDVAAEHVVQQDAEGPHGRRVAAVPAQPDPLGRGVDQGACNGSIQSVRAGSILPSFDI